MECIKECKIENSYFHIELQSTFGAFLEVQEADLGEDRIGEKGIDASAAVLAAVLETNTTLTKLVLGDNYLGPGGAKSLATALKINTALTNLNLRRNNLRPESLTTALKTNTTLTNLDFSGSTLGPVDAGSLATALKTNTALTNLNLRRSNLRPEVPYYSA